MFEILYSKNFIVKPKININKGKGITVVKAKHSSRYVRTLSLGYNRKGEMKPLEPSGETFEPQTQSSQALPSPPVPAPDAESSLPKQSQ